jgi:formamidopyrimidine-DNA glycosylase
VPELPDVEVFRRRVARSSLKQDVAEVSVHDPRMLHEVSEHDLRGFLRGRAMTATHRHGKHLLIDVEGGGVLGLHFGMTGYPVTGTGRPPEGQHVRVVIGLAGARWLALVDQRRLGRVAVAETRADHVSREALGPDALTLSVPELREAVGGARGQLKTTLTDQSRVAGLGNIYADEVLFHAGLDPRGATRDLSDHDHGRLHRQLRRVLELAIARRADPDRLPRGWLLPHREEGRRCPKGRGVVTGYRAGGRRGYWCPTCQGGGADSY